MAYVSAYLDTVQNQILEQLDCQGIYRIDFLKYIMWKVNEWISAHLAPASPFKHRINSVEACNFALILVNSH